MMEAEPKPRNKMRIAACIARKDGKSIQQICDELNKAYKTILNWLRRAIDSKGSNRYEMQRPGRKPKINADQIKSLKKDLTTSPKKFGLDSDRWTRTILVKHLKQKYGVTYSEPAVRHLKHLYGLSWHYSPGMGFLPDISRKKLVALRNKESDLKACMILDACIARKDGRTKNEIANRLGVSIGTVHGWLTRLTKIGIRGIYDRTGGEGQRLNEDQINGIRRDLEAGPRSWGFDSDTWFSELLIQHVEKQYGTRYTESGMHRMLRRNGLLKKNQLLRDLYTKPEKRPRH